MSNVNQPGSNAVILFSLLHDGFIFHLPNAVILIFVYVVFDTWIMIVFQNSFYLKIYQNNIIFTNFIFDISTSKQSKNIKKIKRK
jgi:hypothetical protein